MKYFTKENVINVLGFLSFAFTLANQTFNFAPEVVSMLTFAIGCFGYFTNVNQKEVE